MNINEIHETIHEGCNVHENIIHEHDESSRNTVFIDKFMNFIGFMNTSVYD